MRVLDCLGVDALVTTGDVCAILRQVIRRSALRWNCRTNRQFPGRDVDVALVDGSLFKVGPELAVPLRAPNLTSAGRTCLPGWQFPSKIAEEDVQHRTREHSMSPIVSPFGSFQPCLPLAVERTCSTQRIVQ